MKVVVLMGGYGTRMRPHSWSRPKPVMQVAGNTVISPSGEATKIALNAVDGTEEAV